MGGDPVNHPLREEGISVDLQGVHSGVLELGERRAVRGQVIGVLIEGAGAPEVFSDRVSLRLGRHNR